MPQSIVGVGVPFQEGRRDIRDRDQRIMGEQAVRPHACLDRAIRFAMFA